jgi:hypothetical protein
MARTRWSSELRIPASCPGQADQTGSAGSCLKTWARPTDRFAGQPERRQPIRRSGRDPGPRPYAHTTAKQRMQGRKHYPHPPCRFRIRNCCAVDSPESTPILQICAIATVRCLNDPNDGISDEGIKSRADPLSSSCERFVADLYACSVGFRSNCQDLWIDRSLLGRSGSGQRS